MKDLHGNTLVSFLVAPGLLAILATLDALDDVTTSANSKKICAGKGEAHGRRYVLRYVLRRGLLIIHK